MATLAYVVYNGKNPVTVYQDRAQAEWCVFLMGRHASIKRFTSKTLMQLLTKRRRMR